MIMSKIIKSLIGKEVRIVLKNNNKIFGILESCDEELYINSKGNIIGIKINNITKIEENL